MPRSGQADAGERVRTAAIELFATRGFHGTGIRDLAEAAGLSSATLYHYMGTKEDLLLDLMRNSLTRLLAAAEEVGAQWRDRESPDPVAGLVELVAMHVRTHAEQPLETRVADGELRALTGSGRAEILELRDRYERIWRDVIEAGERDGVLQVPDARVARLALLEMCSSVSRWYSPTGALRPSEVADLYVELALRMLGAET